MAPFGKSSQTDRFTSTRGSNFETSKKSTLGNGRATCGLCVWRHKWHLKRSFTLIWACAFEFCAHSLARVSVWGHCWGVKQKIMQRFRDGRHTEYGTCYMGVVTGLKTVILFRKFHLPRLVTAVSGETMIVSRYIIIVRALLLRLKIMVLDIWAWVTSRGVRTIIHKSEQAVLLREVTNANLTNWLIFTAYNST